MNRNNLKKFPLAHGAGFLIILAGSLIMLFPFLWMVLTSFKSFAESMRIPIQWLPEKFLFSNYKEVLTRMHFSRYYFNTVMVTVTVVGAQLLTCSAAAYAFARIEFIGKDIVFFIILSILMIPSQMTLIPRYTMMTSIGWQNTYLGLIVPMIPSAYGIFMLRQFFKSLPRELDDAGKIDGCGHPVIFFIIDLPLCKSALISYGVINALWAWNELLWPLIISNSNRMYVLSLALSNMVGQNGTFYQLLMAGSVLATFPMLLLYIAAQKYFIKGIAMSGIKG